MVWAKGTRMHVYDERVDDEGEMFQKGKRNGQKSSSH